MSEKYVLAKVTPRAMREIKELGLHTSDTAEYVQRMTDIYTDPEKLNDLCRIIFEHPPEASELEDIDLSMINQAVKSFASAQRKNIAAFRYSCWVNVYEFILWYSGGEKVGTPPFLHLFIISRQKIYRMM